MLGKVCIMCQNTRVELHRLIIFFWYSRKCKRKNDVIDILKTQDFRLQTQDFRLQTQDFRLQTQDFRLQTQDFRLQTQDFRLQTSDTRLQTSDTRLQTSDTRLQIRDFRHKHCTSGRPRPTISQNTSQNVTYFLKHKRNKRTQKPVERDLRRVVHARRYRGTHHKTSDTRLQTQALYVGSSTPYDIAEHITERNVFFETQKKQKNTKARKA